MCVFLIFMFKILGVFFLSKAVQEVPSFLIFNIQENSSDMQDSIRNLQRISMYSAIHLHQHFMICHYVVSLCSCLLQTVSVELQTSWRSPEDWSHDGGVCLQVLPMQSWRLPIHRYHTHTHTHTHRRRSTYMNQNQTDSPGKTPRTSQTTSVSDRCFSPQHTAQLDLFGLYKSLACGQNVGDFPERLTNMSPL